MRAVEDVTEESFDRMFRTNVRSALLVTKEASPHLTEGASIVNISSVVAKAPFGNPANVEYVATKGALDAFTRALAVELAPRKIRVNTLSPGVTETDMAPAGMPEALRKYLADLALFKRFGTAEEVAGSIVFLLSKDSTWVTGQNFGASGGFSFSL
ncbi:hypothetical protein BC830DRAFT_1096268 [Chytriomyces sp. MP71]|nr:hypothetical protein BC830DRAFT_1096268 [Chytriomyces sp. MP71]